MLSPQDDTDKLAAAMAALHNNVHYLRAISAMACQREVRVVQPVVSDRGVLLLAKDSTVGANLMEVLGDHRLPSALDAQLSVSEPVDIALLVVEITRLMGEHPLGQLLAADLGPDGALMGRALQHMVWPPPARFMMTVVHSQLPSLFEHSLLMAMVALYLGIRAGWDEAQCAKLAAAALLHDIGMLFMSTSWMDAEYKLSERERAQLAAHSITGSMLVQSMRAYPRSVEDAVLEHHECMDGSGYPRQLLGDALSPMGRVLVVAEVVSAFFDKYTVMPAERLALVLRLNSRRYPAEQVAQVLTLLQRTTAAACEVPHDTVLRDCHTVGTVLQYWASCKRVLPPQWQAQAGSRALMWVDARMRALELSLAESGAHARAPGEWQALFAQVPESVAELGLIHREALWQIEQCIASCQRRRPQAHNPASVVERALRTWLHSSSKALDMETAPA